MEGKERWANENALRKEFEVEKSRCRGKAACAENRGSGKGECDNGSGYADILCVTAAGIVKFNECRAQLTGKH